MGNNEQETLDFMKAMRAEFGAFEFRMTNGIAIATSKNFKDVKPGNWINPQVYVRPK